jgi:uncharacterized membrane protein YsdA (DUF1294 family)/cold shock CspA family protein
MRFEGTLKSWEDERGFGFIQPDQGGDEIFVHIKAMVNRQGRPQIGQRFTFEVELGPHGKKRAKGVLPYRAPTSIKLRTGARRFQQQEKPARWGMATVLAIPIFALIFTVVMVAWRPPIAFGLVYIGASLVAYIAYALDKSAAVRGQWRTPEKTLHTLALVGGWPGALLAQQVLRHKSSKAEFRWFFWTTVVLNVAAFIFICSPSGRSLWPR